MRAVDGVPQDRDELRVRNAPGDALVRRVVAKVERGGLAFECAGGSVREQGLVILAAPDVFGVGRRIPGAATGGGWPVDQEVLGFLVGGQEQLWMAIERDVQRRRPALRSADDEEIRQCHELLLSTHERVDC